MSKEQVVVGDPKEKKRFTFSLRLDATLSVDQIWPDGAPENPTAQDAVESLRDTHPSLFSALDEWNLEEEADLTVMRVGDFKDRGSW